MTITTTTLSRAAGLAAVVAGLLFIAVQIKHPHQDIDLVTTTEWQVRYSMKVAMASLSLIGITGMYLRQVTQAGVLGLVGYVLFAANYVVLLCVEVVGLAVLPSIAGSSPGYVSDIIAVGNGGTASGDLGLLETLSTLQGVGYVAGGLVFGLALLRGKVLARWAALLLALGTVAAAAIPMLPDVNQRLFAIPTGIALIGLGYSLWSGQRTRAARPVSGPLSLELDPSGAR
jgi:hypothetical protein